MPSSVVMLVQALLPSLGFALLLSPLELLGNTALSQEGDLACCFWDMASSAPVLGALAGGGRTRVLLWRLKWARSFMHE